MNRIYKLVWSPRLNALVVVGEGTRGCGKSGANAKAMLGSAVASALLALGAGPALADCTSSSSSQCVLDGTTNTSVNLPAGQVIAPSNYPAVTVPISAVAGNIFNAGTLSGDSGMAGVIVEGTLSGGINNSGTASRIAGGPIGANYLTGLYVSGGKVNGGVVNQGMITGIGVWARGSSAAQVLGGISNLGAASEISSGQNSAAIAVTASKISGGIVNSGLISGTASSGDGILLDNWATLSGGIQNLATGRMIGAVNGIAVLGASSMDGGIANSGLIEGISGSAILLSGASLQGDIQNLSGGTLSGTTGISVTSSPYVPGGTPIPVRASSVSGSIINAGTIDAQGTAAAGISVKGAYDSGLARYVPSAVAGSLINNGAISSSVSGSTASTVAGVWVAGSSSITGAISNTSRLAANAQVSSSGPITGYAYGVLLSYLSSAGSVSNSGTISGTSNVVTTSTANNNNSRVQANAIGVYLSQSAVAGDVVNSGSIVATGSAQTGSSNAGRATDIVSGVRLTGGSTIGGQIVNSGTIQATGVSVANGVSLAGGIGIYLDATSRVSGITNAGLIGGNSKSLSLGNSANSFDIANTGTLQGDAAIGINTLNLNGAGGRVIGNTTGTGAVNVNGTFTSEGGFNVGAFSVADGGLFNWLTPAHTITAGTMTVNSGSILNVGTSSQTLSGNYAQNAGGVYRIGLADATSSYGKLNVTNATLANGAMVNVNIIGTPSLTAGTVVPGVIRATGTLTAAPAGVVVTDNSLLYNFIASSSRDPKQLDLVAVVNPHAFDGAGGSSKASSQGAAKVLQDMLGNGIPAAMAPVFGALIPLNAQQLATAVSQMLPAVQGAGSQAGINALHSMNKIIQSRVESSTGLSSGDGTPDKFLWGRAFGNDGRQSDLNGVSGFKSNSGGVVLGGDAPVTPKLRAGGAFTYARSRITGNSDAAPNHVDVDTFELVGYASYNLDPVTDINYQLDVGKNQAHSYRGIPLMGTAASADFSSVSTHGSVGIGRLLTLSERTNITPSVRLDYTRMRTDGYTETGADALDLAVDGQVFREFLATGDVKFARQWTDQLKLVGNASVGYDLLNLPMQTTSTFTGGGAAFVTNGLAVSPWIYRAGLGLIKTGKTGVEYSLRYDAEARSSGYLNQTLSVRARWAL